MASLSSMRSAVKILPLLPHSCKSAIQQGVCNFVKMASPLDKIPDVDIDGNGIFKYILVNIHDDNNKESKPIVRGYANCTWHADIYEQVGKEVTPLGAGLDTECVGGGRINHDASLKSINVYGYSQGFGQADHQISVNLLKKKYPDYVITCSNDGY